MANEMKDACEVCEGKNGGVPGNENVVNGHVICDYCHADYLNGKLTLVHVAPPERHQQQPPASKVEEPKPTLASLLTKWKAGSAQEQAETLAVLQEAGVVAEEPADAKAKLERFIGRLEKDYEATLYEPFRQASKALRVFYGEHRYIAPNEEQLFGSCSCDRNSTWPCPVLEKAAEGL